jgi:hypothetical protein
MGNKYMTGSIAQKDVNAAVATIESKIIYRAAQVSSVSSTANPAQLLLYWFGKLFA